MSSPSTLHFPDSVTMTQYLSNHPLLKRDYYRDSGITKAIVEIAAARFAVSEKVEMDVKNGAKLLINDLVTGKDELTGKALSNLGKLGLSAMVWEQVAQATEIALLDCANSVKV